MTRKKIGIYCTAFWGNNNKNHCCRRRHPMPRPLDPGCSSCFRAGDRQTDWLWCQGRHPFSIHRSGQCAQKYANRDPECLETRSGGPSETGMGSDSCSSPAESSPPKAGLPAADSCSLVWAGAASQGWWWDGGFAAPC